MIERSDWECTIFIVPKNNQDYWDRFGSVYPEVMRHVKRVHDAAGCSSDTVGVDRAAGALLADQDNWIRRACEAMQKRSAPAMDRLCQEAQHRWPTP
jgi:hypothetical protein